MEGMGNQTHMVEFTKKLSSYPWRVTEGFQQGGVGIRVGFYKDHYFNKTEFQTLLLFSFNELTNP